MVRRDAKARFGVFSRRDVFGGNLELAPESIDVFLLIVKSSELHHVVPRSGVCTICANKEVKIYFNLTVATRGGLGVTHDFEPGFVVVEISAGEFVVEEDLDVGHSFYFVEKDLVELTSVNC